MELEVYPEGSSTEYVCVPDEQEHKIVVVVEDLGTPSKTTVQLVPEAKPVSWKVTLVDGVTADAESIGIKEEYTDKSNKPTITSVKILFVFIVHTQI
ncbi:MAG: hypothetical protein NWF05_01580 [Candidatus Bathyarchaeota archaeon]|nr:hypothetical protein [Candidatus Bathyarchaeota archaeon]